MNYFELFDFPVAPVIDRSAVAKKYFELQKKSHPDFFTKESETEQDEALEQSAAINKAFNIFQDEERTIEYFLRLKDVVQTDEKYQLPPDFLMEMMELNETLVEKEPADATNEIEEKEQELKAGIASILNKPTNDLNEADLAQLKAYYYKKKYLQRILDRLAD